MNDILFWVLILLLVVASIITIIKFLIVFKRFREHENNSDTSDKGSTIDIHNPPNRGSNVITPKNPHVIVFPLPEDDSRQTISRKHPTNCKNCGAVLHSNICEFCGTEYT